MGPTFETLATDLDHPEGVAVDGGGAIVAGGEAGQVYRIVDGEVTEIGSTGGFLFGVTLDGAGTVFACDFGLASVQRITADGEVATWSNGTADRSMRIPNFAAFDDAGNLYVTDSAPWGEDDGLVYLIGPDGGTEVWTDAVPRFPNGCCLTPSGDALLVVESRGRQVMRVPIEDDGSAGTPSVEVDLTGSQPDGIALAADGSMFVGCYRPDRIWHVDPDGHASVWAEDEDGVVLNQPANVAFLGTRLVVSSLGGWSLVAAEAGVEGVPLRRPVVR